MLALFDLDNCVFDARWREHLIEAEGWDAFHAKMGEDKPNRDIVTLIMALMNNGHRIGGLTGRPERYRAMTVGALIAHRIPMHLLLMRPENDWRPSPVMKVDLVVKHIAQPPDDILVFDDREDICNAFAEMGIRSMLVFQKRGQDDKGTVEGAARDNNRDGKSHSQA